MAGTRATFTPRPRVLVPKPQKRQLTDRFLEEKKRIMEAKTSGMDSSNLPATRASRVTYQDKSSESNRHSSRASSRVTEEHDLKEEEARSTADLEPTPPTLGRTSKPRPPRQIAIDIKTDEAVDKTMMCDEQAAAVTLQWVAPFPLAPSCLKTEACGEQVVAPLEQWEAPFPLAPALPKPHGRRPSSRVVKLRRA